MEKKEKTEHLYLTGFMGSGKSTIGKNLAKKLGIPFIDTDNIIEMKKGIEISEIFEHKGEKWFRDYEENTLENIINSSDRLVISLGGGSLMSEKNLKRVLSTGKLIYIKSSPDQIWKRIRHSTRRPLLRQKGVAWTRERYIQRINELMKARESGYYSAHLIIDRDGKEVDEVVAQLLLQLSELVTIENTAISDIRKNK